MKAVCTVRYRGGGGEHNLTLSLGRLSSSTRRHLTRRRLRRLYRTAAAIECQRMWRGHAGRRAARAHALRRLQAWAGRPIWQWWRRRQLISVVKTAVRSSLSLKVRLK